MPFQNKNCALLISHPGHELAVYHWLELAKPLTFILTDGSGRENDSRVNSSLQLLKAVGARTFGTPGRFRDREFYQAVEKRELKLFCALADEIAAGLVEHQIEFVLGDAEEGRIMTHDVFRLIVNAAIEMAETKSNRMIESYEFSPEGMFAAVHPKLRARALTIQLDVPALERKRAALAGYTELQSEIKKLIALHGEQSLACENLWPFDEIYSMPDLGQPLGYEEHGQKLVASGLYQTALTYREHVEPIALALRDYVNLSR